MDERARADKKKEEADHALALSQADDWKRPGYSCQTDNDEALVRALHDSLNPFGCPPYAPSYVLPQYCNRGYRLCGGCNRDIGYGKYLRCRGFFHPERFLCSSCGYPITENETKLMLRMHGICYMDTGDCQPLYHAIRDYYEGMNVKLDQQIPMLLVERQALNEARVGEKNGYHHMPETRGLCLSEELTVTSIQKRPRIGGNRLVGVSTQPQKLTRKSCEVTAILVLYGLPRLLTGAILAHELMHAWLRLKGYRNLNLEAEEGVCQVLSYMWLNQKYFRLKSCHLRQ
ncbi:hypothetical protein GH714_036439 [Hevea brasiliensis]|uniref:Protein DA1-like domain-containing protein n=1 Tax=Hevea brasiliensis TaxID=3981 RepID=A0A6A6L7S6_HEVBR|nr:hypothetical protein GH714_036439 [Hevea brasiliensis]